MKYAKDLRYAVGRDATVDRLMAAARAQALSEAARICESLAPYSGANARDHYRACAAAIRSLRDTEKPD